MSFYAFITILRSHYFCLHHSDIISPSDFANPFIHKHWYDWLNCFRCNLCENISWTPKKSLYVSEGQARSLLLQKGHLKVTKKRKSTCEKLVSAWFSMWTSQGLNLGPPDYESVALTNWATSPIVLSKLCTNCTHFF